MPICVSIRNGQLFNYRDFFIAIIDIVYFSLTSDNEIDNNCDSQRNIYNYSV